MMTIFAWALLQAQTVPPAEPPPPPPLHGSGRPMTCPVGGEAFSAWQATMYSTYGERPDGRPFSYMPFPFPLPECPGNHLVVFDNFSDAEQAALATLIASPDYAKLVADGEGQHYRAFWLATRLGRPEGDALGWLHQALWATTPGANDGPDDPANAARRQRYAREFVARVHALPAETSVADRLWLTARAANQLRQLSDFAGAEAMRKAALPLVGQHGTDKNWGVYLDKLGRVIARRDASPEPLDMIPSEVAADHCHRSDSLPLSRADRRLCAAALEEERAAN